MRREDLRTLLTALGLADQSSNPNRISAVEAWRTSQEALRADAGNNLLSVHDVVQLTSDAAKMGPIVSIDASAGSLTVKFDGESTTTTVPLASVQRWTRDGTTGQQPDPKRQRTSPVAALAKLMVLLAAAEHEGWARKDVERLFACNLVGEVSEAD